MLRIKRETYNFINDIASTKKGNLSIGFTPGRGIAMFTSVYPAFHLQYPHIVLQPMEISVKIQQGFIASGDLDIGFMTLHEKDKTSDNYVNIDSEEIYLVIPKEHSLAKLAAPPGEPFSILDITELRDEPFVLMYKESTIRGIVDNLFQQANFIPNVLFETSNTSTIVTMIKSNLCCGLIPYYYIKDHLDEMACFSLAAKPTWDIVASYKKDSHLSNAAQFFIELATEFWRN
jgi:DNA-binding transcriptional LysR family regulator